MHCQFYFQLGVLLPSSRAGLPALLRRRPAAVGRPPAASSPLLAAARPPRPPPRAQRRPMGEFQQPPADSNGTVPQPVGVDPGSRGGPPASPVLRGEGNACLPIRCRWWQSSGALPPAGSRGGGPCSLPRRLPRRRPLQPPMAAPAAALPSRAGTAGSSAGGGRAGVRRPPARPALARRPAVPSLWRAAR